MKSIVSISLIILLFSCESGVPQGETMPSFEILLSDSATHLNTSDIKKGGPIALMYFSPDCEHCQQETTGILQKMDSLKNVRFYFVTNDEFEGMITFKKYYHLDKYPNITIGRDKDFFMIRHFKGIVTPFMVIYDKDKRQSALFNGETTTSKVISAVNNL